MNVVGYGLGKYSLDAVKKSYVLLFQFNTHIALGYGEYNPKWLNKVYFSYPNNKVRYVQFD